MQCYNPVEDVWMACHKSPVLSNADRYFQDGHIKKIVMLPIIMKNKMTLFTAIRGEQAIESNIYAETTDPWSELNPKNSPKWSNADNHIYTNFPYNWTFHAVVMNVDGQQRLFVLMRTPHGIELYMYDSDNNCWQAKKNHVTWSDGLP